NANETSVLRKMKHLDEGSGGLGNEQQRLTGISKLNRLRIVTIVGTRPEVIKMAPVVLELQRWQAVFDHTLVNTSQHREMLVSALTLFGIIADIDLKQL